MGFLPSTLKALRAFIIKTNYEPGSVPLVEGTLTDGDYGDITISGAVTVFTIDNSVVTTAKMGGDVTAAGKAILDDADATAQRTTLGAAALAHTHAQSDVTNLTTELAAKHAGTYLTIEGLEGEQGPPGPVGPPGVGVLGPIGPAIFLEAEGPEGEPGPPGVRGVDGVAGAPGTTGAQGPAGPPVYLQADAGEDGLPGTPGPPGSNGANGTTGAQGPIGPAIFLDAEPGEDGLNGPPGATGPQGPAGGGGGSWTTVEANLGGIGSESWRGRFTLTDATITPSSKVVIMHAPGPYTGKGTRADESEMDPLWCVAEPGSGQATVYWRTMAGIATVFNDVKGTQPVTAVSIQHGGPFLAGLIQRVLGRVRGNVKFTYQVGT